MHNVIYIYIYRLVPAPLDEKSHCTCWLSHRCRRSPSRPRWQPADHLSSWRPAWGPLVSSDWPPPSSRCPFPGERTAVQLPPPAPANRLPARTPKPYQLVLLAARLALFLRQLPHFLLHVPDLPLHSLVLLLLPVLRRYALVPLLCHLLKVLLETADQTLRGRN